MNTFQQINTSRRLNRAFWNNTARYHIQRLRKAQLSSGTSDVRAIEQALQSALTHRSTFHYFG